MSRKYLSNKYFLFVISFGLSTGWLTVEPVFSQVTVEQALQLVPVQKRDVDYSQPDDSEIKDCTVSSPTEKNLSGWIVKDPAGRLLRRFLDTNGDQDIDLWCYYRDGFEVYRDIDSNYDRKADQYRWFGSQGTRWGIDDDQDGRIDSWKRISAEEVSEEVAKALGNGDAEQFRRLLISDDELESVGFADDKIKELKKSLGQSSAAFAKLLQSNQSLRKAEWLHFGGLRPGVIPEGTEGASKDIFIYENVAALVKAGSDSYQISLGTMIQVDQCWRLIDAPEVIDEKGSSSFASWYRAVEGAEASAGSSATLSAGYQALLEEFQNLDKQLDGARTRNDKIRIYDKLATTISDLAVQATDDEDSLNWTRQFADTITAAIQSDEFPEGLDRLKEFVSTLKKKKKSTEAIALVSYRFINAEFGAKLNDTKVNVAEAQTEWLGKLEEFTKDYPTDPNVPDAIMQLAMADEFEGKPGKAKDWYQTIATKFGDSPYAAKAKGAIRRLSAIGEKMKLAGTTVNGKPFDISDMKGKVVLVHYWADWCEICKDEFGPLEKLAKKYPDLKLVGINCDNDLASAKTATARTGVSWPQLHSNGGYNEGFAAEMGIVSLPSMILIDQNGEIVSTTVSTGTLERELKSILK